MSGMRSAEKLFQADGVIFLEEAPRKTDPVRASTGSARTGSVGQIRAVCTELVRTVRTERAEVCGFSRCPKASTESAKRFGRGGRLLRPAARCGLMHSG